MIEALRNTAVKVENEIQARCVVALYELVGFKTDFSDSDYKASVGLYIGNYGPFPKEVVPTAALPNAEITLDQLAWNYDLAPEWAVNIKFGDTPFFSDGIKQVQRISSGIQTYLAGDESMCQFDLISTRPQAKQEQQWPEKGSLPPIGVECECTWGGKVEWARCILSTHGRVFTSQGIEHLSFYEDDESFEFRPIQTERDKFIEKAYEVNYPDWEVSKELLGNLYDAGARFND
jgi:hypothetical protein